MNKRSIVLLPLLACSLLLYATDSSAYNNVNQGCLGSCHTQSSLMGVDMGASCTGCHESAGGDKKVLSAKCIVCHPIGNPGQCNLTKTANHNALNCKTCHTDCATGTTTTTSAGPGTTTTTSISSGTTTTTAQPGPCPAEKILGEGSPNLAPLQAYRDNKLANSTIGRKVILIYYNNADLINDAIERNPALREAARRVLEVIAPVVGKQ
jgi:hypothetical protein